MVECTPKMRHTVKQLSYCEENRDDVSTKKTKDQPRVQDCCGTGARERQERGRGGAGLPGGYLDAAPLAGGVGERSGERLSWRAEGECSQPRGRAGAEHRA